MKMYMDESKAPFKVSIMSQKTDTNRIYQIDGIRGLFILLVVLGHLIGGGYSNDSPLGLMHYCIYSFHMPMFILITGVLSKKKADIKRIISNYVIPYIVFDLGYVFFGTIIGQSVSWNILVPSFAYWYILCIAIMKLLYSKIRIEIILIASVVISVLVIFFVNESTWRILSFGRVMLLLPVFYIGTLLHGECIMNIMKHRVICITSGIIAVIIIFIFLKFGITTIDWATHDYYNSLLMLTIKYAYMILTVSLFLCLFCIIPELKILQRWGRNSIIVYLVHPFVVPIVKHLVSSFASSEIAMFTIIVISAFIITDVLSLDIFKRVYDKFIGIVIKIFKVEG